MKVKQRLHLSVTVSAITAFIIILILFVTLYRVNNEVEANKIVNGIVRDIFERKTFESDYLRTNSKRAKLQWLSLNKQISKYLKSASDKLRDAEGRTTIEKMLNVHESTEKIFLGIIENREKAGPTADYASHSDETEDRLLSQLIIRSYDTMTLAHDLQELSNRLLFSTLKLAGGVIFCVMSVVSTVTIINLWSMSRTITNRIGRLRDGSALIGDGNLNHRIDIKGDDEFADLSEAFNAMTSRVSMSYLALEKEIAERKRAEDALRESEKSVRRKLESILSPEGDIGDMALDDIVDTVAIQSLINSFYDLIRLPMAILDLKGKVLAGVGWQDICTGFHRRNPETCRNCTESDIKLSAGVPQGKFKLYKCKNNMWDVSTPIMIGGKHVGNLFMGQFFFQDESLDYGLFRAQAKNYGFNEEEYIAALEKVQRISRDTLDKSMAFFLKLAELLSQLSYSNIKLARSLTERDSLMGIMRQQTIELETANKEMESFIYSVSHDLRGPLRAISGFSQMLLQDSINRDDDKRKDYLNRIHLGAARMGRLIEDLLRLSHISRQDITRTEMNLSYAAAAVIAELRESNPDRKIDIKIEEGLTASADSGLITIVLSNLLGNAWKFTSKTENARIGFATVGEGGKTVYCVKDNGAGFNREYADKIFWPFHRLHQSEEFEGTGIGLAIVERIIRRHGGKIWAEGEVNKGAAFFFTLG